MPDFARLTEAKILIEEWRKEYNHVRSHRALKYGGGIYFRGYYSVDSNLISGTVNGGQVRLMIISLEG